MACSTTGNWLKRSSLSGLADGVEDLLDISSVDRLSFIRQSSKVNMSGEIAKSLEGQDLAGFSSIWTLQPMSSVAEVGICYWTSAVHSED